MRGDVLLGYMRTSAGRPIARNGAGRGPLAGKLGRRGYSNNKYLSGRSGRLGEIDGGGQAVNGINWIELFFIKDV